MKAPVAYHPEANADIASAYVSYEQIRNGLGEQFLQEVSRSLDVICETPELYAVVHEDIRAVPMRRFPHLIYFRLEIETVVIVAVMHGRRGEAALVRRLT